MEELLVGLTSDPNVLRQWMVSGPEVAKTIVEFKDANLQLHNHDEYSHHEQSHRVQKSFTKDVQVLLVAFKDLGNPFEEDS